MSAYICEPELFKALGIFAAERRHGTLRVNPDYLRGPAWKPLIEKASERANMRVSDNLTELASLYADVLYRENIRSVSCRYPDCNYEELPGPVSKPLRLVVTNRDMASSKLINVKAVHILKMCACLEYQSCETGDWEQTAAHELLERIRHAAINALPGYDDAPWGFAA